MRLSERNLNTLMFLEINVQSTATESFQKKSFLPVTNKRNSSFVQKNRITLKRRTLRTMPITPRKIAEILNLMSKLFETTLFRRT
jgi:hypothetical protein